MRSTLGLGLPQGGPPGAWAWGGPPAQYPTTGRASWGPSCSSTCRGPQPSSSSSREQQQDELQSVYGPALPNAG
ncbi:hypothetical protein ETH_00040430, partial [Eimeria tenella]